jgi:hypothetical protein
MANRPVNDVLNVTVDFLRAGPLKMEPEDGLRCNTEECHLDEKIECGPNRLPDIDRVIYGMGPTGIEGHGEYLLT